LTEESVAFSQIRDINDQHTDYSKENKVRD
jgi:hypothetical protein